MGIIIRLYKPLVLFFWVLAPVAVAADPALPPPPPLYFIGQYAFDWNGIRLGSLALAINEARDAYSLRIQVKSEGVVNLFTRHSNDTEVSGKRSGTIYLPQFYESFYKTKDKPRHIRLRFDAQGVNTEELNEPPENRALRPEVPHALKDGSYDPLTSLMVLRAGAQKWRGFDAKHLYEAHSQKTDNAKLLLPVGSRNATAYVLSRIPLAGITAKEEKEFKKGEPPLTLYLSDDERRVPLGMSMPLYGQVKGLLVKECKTWDECKL